MGSDDNKKRIRHEAYDDVLTMIKAGVSPFMVGPSGSGKTTLARNIAKDMGLNFYYSGAVESAFQLRGFKDANGGTVKTPFRTAYEEGGLFLFDELDASDAQAIVSLHAALDNGVLDAPDGIIEQHEDFHYLAAGNTWGNGANLQYMGRNALDGATIDRYAITTVDYDTDLEKRLIKNLVGEEYLYWQNIVLMARKSVFDLEMRHVVSTRASINGAKLLKAGFSVEKTFDKQILKGLDPDQATQLMGRVDFEATEVADMIKPDRIEELRNIMNKVSNVAVDLADTEKKLKRTHGEAMSLQEKALDGMSDMAKQLEKASGTLRRLNDNADALEGMNRTSDAVSKAAAEALEHIKASSPKPLR